jgi:hypothetical protein
MTYQLKPVRCENCKNWTRDKVYLTDGICGKNGRVKREFHVCNLLPTNEDKRKAKIKLYK